MEIDYNNYNNKIGLVGAGGGVRVAEVMGGILKAMTEHEQCPDYMWLTSGASLAGPVYYSSESMRTSMLPWFQANPIDDILIAYYWIATGLFGKPAYDNDKLLEVMRAQLGDVVYENVICTITDSVTRETLYVPADWQTAVASTSIPKVFRERILCNKNWYRRIVPQAPDEPITAKLEFINKKTVHAIDGGIYDMIPIPEREVIERLKHLFVIIPNDDTTPESIHKQSTVGQALSWIIETMEREYREVVATWGNHPKVTILKPMPCASSLLNWSKDFVLFQHSYNYGCNVLSKLHNKGVI